LVSRISSINSIFEEKILFEFIGFKLFFFQRNASGIVGKLPFDPYSGKHSKEVFQPVFCVFLSNAVMWSSFDTYFQLFSVQP